MHIKNGRGVIVIFVWGTALLLFSVSSWGANVEAKRAEELMVVEKRIEEEKEKAMVTHFYEEGMRLLEEGDYEGATDQFSRVLEIDPEHSKAKRGIKKVRQMLAEEKKLRTPEAMAKKLLIRGRVKYGRKDFEGAIEDFQNALILDYKNEEILEWLKRARRRKGLAEAKKQQEDLEREINLVGEKKAVQEDLAMLEVDAAYLPPEKPERKPIEVEEIVSAEEEEEEKARKELIKRLRDRMVPAVSLKDADIRDVIRQLMEITNVTIVIDEGALTEAAGEEPIKMTFATVTPLPLLEVLDIALRATELAYRIEPNYVWISTPAKLEKEDLVTKTYRLRYGVRRIRKVELKEFDTCGSSE